MPTRYVPPNVVEFGAMMRARREAMGLTQLQVARLAGADDGQIVGSWERGAKVPTLTSALRWLKGLGMQIVEGGSDGPAAQ